MIGQFLSNTNESATVSILQNFLELNKALVAGVARGFLFWTPSKKGGWGGRSLCHYKSHIVIMSVIQLRSYQWKPVTDLSKKKEDKANLGHKKMSSKRQMCP